MIYNILVSLIFAFFSITSYELEARSRLKAALHFDVSPGKNELSHAPRVYYCGKIISTYPHGNSQATFDIPKNSNQNKFYLLIVEEFSKKPKDKLEEDDYQNTIDHLYVKKDTPYKFFVLDLIQDEQDIYDQSMEALVKTEQKAYHWEIHEETLSDAGNIPDSAIIICYFPSSLKEIKGGSLLDLPTIYFMNEALVQNDTTNTQDALAKLQLAVIDTDTIHAPTKRKIETQNNRLLIMDIA